MPFPARCFSSPTTARSWMRSRSGPSQSRTASCTATTAAGRRCCAGARSAREQPRPSELQRVEAEISVREAEVAQLEAKLAEDWSDVDVLAAHKRSRDALTALLDRREALFEAQGE